MKKTYLPDYERAEDGVDYIAIGTGCATLLGRSLALGAAVQFSISYLGEFASLGGLVRYMNRNNDPFARTTVGEETDLEILTTFDPSYDDHFFYGMLASMEVRTGIAELLAKNTLPFVYFLRDEETRHRDPVPMPAWYTEALERTVRAIKAGNFALKKVHAPVVDVPTPVVAVVEEVVEEAPAPVEPVKVKQVIEKTPKVKKVPVAKVEPEVGGVEVLSPGQAPKKKQVRRKKAVVIDEDSIPLVDRPKPPVAPGMRIVKTPPKAATVSVEEQTHRQIMDRMSTLDLGQLMRLNLMVTAFEEKRLFNLQSAFEVLVESIKQTSDPLVRELTARSAHDTLTTSHPDNAREQRMKTELLQFFSPEVK